MQNGYGYVAGGGATLNSNTGNNRAASLASGMSEINGITREQDVEGNSGRDKYGAEYCQGRAVLARFQLTATA